VRNPQYWYSGKLVTDNTVTLAIDDPGLLYGATVFTTLRVYNQSLDSQLTNWYRHHDRLQESICAFGWQEPDWQRLRQGVEALLPFFPVLRVTLFPDGRELVTGRFLPTDLAERQQRGVVAWVAAGGGSEGASEQLLTSNSEFRIPNSFQRCLPGHKTGNYLSAWLALTQAQQYGAKEAILVDEGGNWLETSTGNLWGWRDGRWWTPPLETGVLPGVVQSHLLDWLQTQNRKVGQVPWDQDFVSGLEAIAYTNSVVQVVPIREAIDGNRKITCDPHHPSLELLRSLFD
jgi:4-amino-4-deoxychorismate lyase